MTDEKLAEIKAERAKVTADFREAFEVVPNVDVNEPSDVYDVNIDCNIIHKKSGETRGTFYVYTANFEVQTDYMVLDVKKGGMYEVWSMTMLMRYCLCENGHPDYANEKEPSGDK